jgi:hypothetical protein
MDAAEQREEGKDERRARRGSKGRDDSQRERRMLNKGSRRAGKDAVAEGQYGTRRAPTVRSTTSR